MIDNCVKNISKKDYKRYRSSLVINKISALQEFGALWIIRKKSRTQNEIYEENKKKKKQLQFYSDNYNKCKLKKVRN